MIKSPEVHIPVGSLINPFQTGKFGFIFKEVSVLNNRSIGVEAVSN